LVKALSAIFPDRAFRFYNNTLAMHKVLECALPGRVLPAGNASVQDALFQGAAIPDPAFPGGDADGAAVSLWRPFVESAPACGQKALVLIPVLPWPLGPAVLAIDKSLEASFPQWELIPPVLLAPAARALYNLAAEMRNPSRQQYHRIEKAIVGAKSGPPKSRVWRLQGIYLTVRSLSGSVQVDGEKYAELFKSFLEGGFLLPPSAREPAILPAVMSKGEETKLAELLGN
jgi:hypothetical protein